ADVLVARELEERSSASLGLRPGVEAVDDPDDHRFWRILELREHDAITGAHRQVQQSGHPELARRATATLDAYSHAATQRRMSLVDTGPEKVADASEGNRRRGLAYGLSALDGVILETIANRWASDGRHRFLRARRAKLVVGVAGEISGGLAHLPSLTRRLGRLGRTWGLAPERFAIALR